MRERTRLGSMIAVLAVVLAAAALPATAAAQGAYVGAAYSWGTLDVKHVDSSLFDNKARAYKVFAGLDLGNFFGVEGAWVNFGSYDANRLQGLNENPGHAKLDGWDMALTARLTLSSFLTAYGKAGYFFWASQITGADDLLHQVGDRARRGEDPFYGAGLRLSLGRAALIGEWEHFPRGNDIDTDLVSLGVRVNL